MTLTTLLVWIETLYISFQIITVALLHWMEWLCQCFMPVAKCVRLLLWLSTKTVWHHCNSTY